LWEFNHNDIWSCSFRVSRYWVLIEVSLQLSCFSIIIDICSLCKPWISYLVSATQYMEVNWHVLQFCGSHHLCLSSILHWNNVAFIQMEVEIVCFRRQCHVSTNWLNTSFCRHKHIAPSTCWEIEVSSILVKFDSVNS
jgi:hypothetical protein